MLPIDYELVAPLKVDRALGYVYFMDKSHPLASKIGRVYYHRHVASVAAGRWLTSSEHVHHIDNDKKNNEGSNLEILSPKAHRAAHSAPYLDMVCEQCSAPNTTRNPSRRFCSVECSRESSKKFDITAEELARLVWEMPTVHLARRLGVSDVAVAKRCRKLGIRKPPRGYWAGRPYLGSSVG